MTRNQTAAIGLVAIVSAFCGGLVGSWTTSTSSAYAQADLPPDETRLNRYAYSNERTPLQQISIPGGTIAARSFQFTGPDGRHQCTLTLGPASNGPTLVLLNERGELLYTIPPQPGSGARLLGSPVK